MSRNENRRLTPRQVAAQLLNRYFDHDVPRDSAALTYYLLFAIFPLLVFVSTLLGLMHLDVAETMSEISRVVPEDVAAVAQGYLEYVSANPSRRLLWFSLIFSVWFPMRAASCLMHSVRKAYGVGRPANVIQGTLSNFFFTLWLIVTIAVSVGLTTVGRRALEFVSGLVWVPERFIRLWEHLRFAALGVIMLLLLVPLYMLAQRRRCSLRDVLPGILLSLAAWMLLSAAFSYYVEKVAHYSMLYGSIATIVVVLLWLYMSGMVLILGAEFNGILLSRREEKKKAEPEEKQA